MIGGEYPDSGVGSEPEGRCDGRNEENDNDSDPESSSPPSHSSYLSNENKLNGDYPDTVSDRYQKYVTAHTQQKISSTVLSCSL